MRPTKTHRYPLKHVFAWTFLIVFTIVMFLAIMASARTDAEKGDGACTGSETVGRCADKCANQADTLVGFDPITHAAICRAPAPQPTSQNTPDTELPHFEVIEGDWGK